MLNPIRMTEFGFRGFLRFLWRIKGWIFSLLAALLLMVAAGLYVFGGTDCDYGPKEAQIQMGNIEQSLDMYYARKNPHRYPASLDQLVEMRIMQEIPTDPWGTDYLYIPTGRTEYLLVSAGPDGKFATDDDVTPFDMNDIKWTQSLAYDAAEEQTE